VSVRFNLALCRLLFTGRPLAAAAVVRVLLAVGFSVFLLAATARAAEVTLVLADPRNDAAEVGGYYLYYWQRSWDQPTRLDIGKQTTYTLANLQAGQTYYVAVTAHDGNGGRESEFSNVVNTAGTVFAVNAGGPEYIGSNGTLYEADSHFSGGRTTSRTVSIAGTTDDVLYQSSRYGDFAYNVPLPNGPYVVTLHFAEFTWTEVGQRIFDVEIEGTEVISNLDLVATAGVNTAYKVAIPVRVTDEALTIRFHSDRSYAKVSAIRIEAGEETP
jgi:Malectin domain/Fibronectin type III domain